jgi:hypothetical protein
MSLSRICYTRVDAPDPARGLSIGWQPVNVGQGLSQDAINAFTAMQASNQKSPQFDAEDESSREVAQLQVDEGSRTAFFTRISHNVGTDSMGRSIIFADAYTMPEGEFLADPAALAGLSDSNFAFAIESTRSVPAKLQYVDAERATLAQHVEALGLDREQYRRLVQAVVAAGFGSSRRPLHIICDCRQETIFHVMMALYGGLPSSFRPKLSYSTYATDGANAKTLVFDRRVAGSLDAVFDISNGESNAVSDFSLRKFEQLPFIAYAPEHLEHEDEIRQFFQGLQQSLEKLGAPDSIDLDVLHLAESLSAEVSDDELPEKIDDLLLAKIQSDYVDAKIAELLQRINDHDIALNQWTAERLQAKLTQTSNQALKTQGLKWFSTKLRALARSSDNGLDQAAETMLQRYPYPNGSNPDFSVIRNDLESSEEGQKLLCAMYDKALEALPGTADALAQFWQDIAKLPSPGELDDLRGKAFAKAVDRLIPELIRQYREPQQLMERSKELAQRVFGNGDDYVTKFEAAVKRQYWERFQISSVILDSKYSTYFDPVEDQSIDKSLTVKHMMMAYDAFAQHDTEECFRLFNNQAEILFTELGSSLEENDKHFIADQLEQVCIRNSRLLSFDAWIQIARLLEDQQLHRNAAKFLIEQRILKPEQYFKYSLENSQILQDREQLDALDSELKECARNRDETAKTAKELLKIIQKSRQKPVERARNNTRGPAHRSGEHKNRPAIAGNNARRADRQRADNNAWNDWPAGGPVDQSFDDASSKPRPADDFPASPASPAFAPKGKPKYDPTYPSSEPEPEPEPEPGPEPGPYTEPQPDKGSVSDSEPGLLSKISKIFGKKR